MNGADGSAHTADLRSAVQFAVIQICAEEDGGGRTKMSPRALAALSELTYHYAVSCLSRDLELFSDHAGRKRITEQDVLLVVRKNSDIKGKVEQKLKDYAVSSDVLFATTGISKPKTTIKQKEAMKKVADSSDGGGSSTTSEEELDKLQTAKTAQNTTTLFDDEDSSDDAEMDAIKAKFQIKVRQQLVQKTTRRKKSGATVDSDSSIEDVVAPRTKSSSKARFRLPSAKKHKEIDLLDDESSSCCSNNCSTTIIQSKHTQPSLVKEIMANMSLDSLPSDHDENDNR